MTDILIELCSLPGPSGFEQPVTERVLKLLEPYMDETRIDVMGNVIAVRHCGRDNARKLLFDAHIDEPGLIVTGAEEGFLRVASLGGADARQLPASVVRVLAEPPIFGVVCATPPHVAKKEDAEKAIKLEDMFIDVGLSQEATEKAVPPGTPVVFAHGARQHGGDGLCGKALDDRSGFAAILRAVELLKDETLDVDLYIMASTQEEVGMRGAAPGVYAVKPDFSVIIDVNHAKTPDTKPQEATSELGGGVIISRGPNMNARFTQAVINLAKAREIPYQIDVEPGGNSGTNARVIQVSGTGVATALFSLPMKYMHGAHEIVSLDDIESAARLLCETAKECANV